MKKALEFYRENKEIVLFFLKLISLYLAWFIVYDLWLMPDGYLDTLLTKTVAKYSGLWLELFGFKVGFNDGLYTRVVVFLNERRMLGISNACNGQVLYPLFSCFIIATQGPWRNKLLMLVVGNLLIFHANTIRVISLVLLKYYKPEWLDFNHRYTFVILVYGFIFFLWVVWVRKVSGLTFKKQHVKDKRPK